MKTKSVPVGKHHFAIVDANKYKEITIHGWSLAKGKYTFYARRKDKKTGKGILMHRELSGAKRGQEVDHVDGNGLNNTMANIRFATSAQNQQNKGLRSSNTSGFKGVHRRKEGKPYIAFLTANSKTMYLGGFEDITEAAKAYDRAAIKHHGKFARLNFPAN